MRGWIEGFQASIDYIEEHLTESLEIGDVARQAALSPFYYQRIFGALCGMTVGDYIRARRMTLAAQELSVPGQRVIDAAMKYGYDSPDSFARAFQRFHGLTPSQAREKGAPLRALAPLHIKVSMEGGKMLDYRIVEKAPFTIVGTKRRFHSDTGYQDVPAFWREFMAGQHALKGMFGFCVDSDDKTFDYWIADLYQPWQELPANCETCVVPGGLWAEFPCRGPLPDSLQAVNTQIWTEWLPNLQGYSLAGNYSVEVYSPPAGNYSVEVYSPPADRPGDEVNFIWIPLKRD